MNYSWTCRLIGISAQVYDQSDVTIPNSMFGVGGTGGTYTAYIAHVNVTEIQTK